MPGHTGHHPGVDAGQIQLHFRRGEIGPLWSSMLPVWQLRGGRGQGNGHCFVETTHKPSMLGHSGHLPGVGPGPIRLDDSVFKQPVTSRHITSRHLTSRHLGSCRVTS